MIELKELYKSYTNNIAALRGINLSVPQGKIFGVIGQSGAGKSTLIRCVNGLEKPDSGKVIVAGQEITTLSSAALRIARRNIGMIFQHFNLLNTCTVYQNIAFPLELAKESAEKISDRVHALLDLIGLGERKKHYPSELSGGQKQRVAIARALANHPNVLLSDESTSALDPETKHNILQLLKKINATLGVTILLITHEMSVIKEICHDLAIIENGVIIEESPVLNFFSNPQTTTAKKFARTFALHELPENIRARLVEYPNQEINNAVPLWRLSFVGKVAETPLISQLARSFSLDLSILQGHIEEIRDETVGVLLVEVSGTSEKIYAGKQYLHDKGIYVEELGYVRSTS